MSTPRSDTRPGTQGDVNRTNGAGWLLARAERLLADGSIDEAGWYDHVASVITPAYLAGDNPRAQSGKSGDESSWVRGRQLICDAIDRDGTFLDIGCASGYLMECVETWCEARGQRILAHGLDISPQLASLARSRLPRHADRIHTGNAIDWLPPASARFTFVRTGLEYVPVRRQRDLIERLLADVVAPGGRLIIGVYNEVAGRDDAGTTEALLKSWGFAIAGRTERTHTDPGLRYRAVWIDCPANPVSSLAVPNR